MARPPRVLQEKLQAAVQGVRWTYSLFWQLCPHQGVLVWGEGYYNGAIKTRKTVQATEASAEEACLHRSQQLRELYDSLSAGDGGTEQPVRRPTAALQPEDLTESEWFYLMCVSFSFPLGVGLPGKAYSRRQHMWLTGANEADSKVFSRAILAKSACIQTVACIPVLGGVLELGTTERVKEDLGLIKLAKSFFSDDGDSDDRRVQLPPKPALSEQSTSNPASFDPASFRSSPAFPAMFTAVDLPSTEDHKRNPKEETGEEDEEEEEDQVESDSEAGPNHYPDDPVRGLWGSQICHELTPPSQPAVADQPSELMQMELSEDIRLGSPEEYSNTLDADIPMLDPTESGTQPNPHRVVYSDRGFPPFQEPPLTGCGFSDEVLTQEDAQYFQTVSGILERNAHPSSSGAAYGGNSSGSAFSKWSTQREDRLLLPPAAASQRALKYVLFTVPFLHAQSRDDFSSPVTTTSSDPKLRKPATQDELSANHVLAERRRREKLNERFIVLRSLVPFVTRMDKASILGDTIEYVKQLRKKIQDLESRPRTETTTTTTHVSDRAATGDDRSAEKRKVRVVEGKAARAVAAPVNDSLQVSIIENDALLELQCSDREGLLLEVMQTMHRLRMEVAAVQSSTANGAIVANLRAKVKEKPNGKKVSIVEVKKAIHQIISSQQH
ncbi:hypothetical protein H6P81_002465 [Aristolochia fimbriata]|uniref:BHLH domain-containing protein n=2 Tax=Aristolochia fimbriata TaxID=158543 RepID=A0AAV7F9U6_ARIFI|nr:hypothetical protein H6P81_002465 [Aristolochia fimbriata]